MIYDLILIMHFIGLALGVGSGFAMMTLGMATKGLEPAEAGKFMMRASALRKNGAVGLSMLIASGVGLMLDRGIAATFLRGGGAFHTKLLLVAIFAGLFGYSQVLAKRAREKRDAKAAERLGLLGRVMLGLGVGIIVLAVFAFH